MSSKTQWILGLLLLVIAALLWQPWQQGDGTSDADKLNDEQPDFVADNLITFLFDSQGNRQHQIHAQHMRHFSQQRLTLLEQPTYHVRIESPTIKGRSENWQVQAQLGTLYGDERLDLNHNVHIYNESNIGYIQEITTEYLHIDLLKQAMHTDVDVQVLGPQYEIYGKGLLVNLFKQQVELQKHVETLYYPRTYRPSQ